MTSEIPAYFHLGDPESQRLLALRDKDAPYQLEPRRCPLNEEHRQDRRTTTLALEVKHASRDEAMISSWLGERVVHASLAAEFQKRGFTGYRLKPATVRFRDGNVSRDYSELIITGWAGVARPESGIKLLEDCPGCHLKDYSSLRDSTQLIDWAAWTGDDFFLVWPLPSFTLITARVAEALQALGVRTYRIGTLRSLEQRFIPSSLTSLGGFTVGRLSNFLPVDLALKYGKELGLE
jgi:hypothetical protein